MADSSFVNLLVVRRSSEALYGFTSGCSSQAHFKLHGTLCDVCLYALAKYMVVLEMQDLGSLPINTQRMSTLDGPWFYCAAPFRQRRQMFYLERQRILAAS
jgi:hypothetical protein